MSGRGGLPALFALPRVEIPEGDAGRRQRLVVLLICSSSLFMTYLDSTILNVALPTLQRDLHASLPALQWVADSYLLVITSVLLIAGATADRIGRKRLFLIGLTGFSVGSLLCSVAPSAGWLIALRMLQAVGGSMLTPVSLSIVRNVFTDARERAHALGIWSGVFGVAIACGPVVGGVLVSEVGWRSVFWVNVPIGACMIIAARRCLPESRAPRPRPIDVPGQVLMIVFLGALTYAVIEGPAFGWGSTSILVLFVVAAAALVGFVLAERRQAEPLLELRFFRSPPFTGANVVAVLAYTVLAGFLFLITLYLQQVHGYSPLVTGLSLLPATALMAVAGPVAGQIVARRGPRIPLVLSGLLIAAGALVLTGLTAGTSYAVLALAFVLMGAGQGLVNPPITITGVSGMPSARAGVASAVISSSRQFGNVLGVAVMGAMLAAAMGTAGAAVGVPAGGSGADAAQRQAFAAATHGPWWLAVACGLLIMVAGWLTTSRKSLELARVVAESD
ncbi:MAG TPA: DHA2 family efflux MFS transporter permease subunit [Trebonia sp.]